MKPDARTTVQSSVVTFNLTRMREIYNKFTTYGLNKTDDQPDASRWSSTLFMSTVHGQTHIKFTGVLRPSPPPLLTRHKSFIITHPPVFVCDIVCM